MKNPILNFTLFLITGIIIEILAFYFLSMINKKRLSKNALPSLLKGEKTFIIDGVKLDFSEFNNYKNEVSKNSSFNIKKLLSRPEKKEEIKKETETKQEKPQEVKQEKEDIKPVTEIKTIKIEDTTLVSTKNENEPTTYSFKTLPKD